MKNLQSKLLPKILDASLDGLDVGGSMVLPYYDGLSISNIPSSISSWLGSSEFGSGLLSDEIHQAVGKEYQHVVLTLVDGLGFEWFLKYLKQERDNQSGISRIWDHWLQNAVLAPLTSVVPSTTSAALTTYWTGRGPASHGVLGYQVWLKEFGTIANMILLSANAYKHESGGLIQAGFDPETFLPVPTMGPHLVKNGIIPHAFMHRGICNSGLSRMHLADVNIHPFTSLSDLWIEAGNQWEADQHNKTYSYIYWGMLDTLSHRFGPDDPRMALEFSAFMMMLDQYLSRITRQSQGKTLFLMTADHGHIHTDPNPDLELRNHPQLTDCLLMDPTGESRLSYLHVRSGCEQKVEDYLSNTWRGKFKMMPIEKALDAGLLGNDGESSKTRDRLGNYLVIPQGNYYWWWDKEPNPLIGRHGGLSSQEMIVPLIAIPL
jgi:hypothetical protein